MTVDEDLLRLLSAHTGVELAFATPPERMHGGFSADLFSFALRPALPPLAVPLVLRLMRDDAAAGRELAAQFAASAAGYPTPHIYMHGDSAAGLGRPFMIMEHVDARTPMADAGVRGVPRLFRTIGDQLADAMARLHVLGLAVDGADGTETLLAALHDDAARAWLVRERPLVASSVLCHCDLHGENLLVRDGALVAVVDWELAGMGPPELDVARTRLILELLPGISNVARVVLKRPAARTSTAFTDAYAARASLDRNALRWYDVLWAARQCAVADGDGPLADVWCPLRAQLQKRVQTLTGTA